MQQCKETLLCCKIRIEKSLCSLEVWELLHYCSNYFAVVCFIFSCCCRPLKWRILISWAAERNVEGLLLAWQSAPGPEFRKRGITPESLPRRGALLLRHDPDLGLDAQAIPSDSGTSLKAAGFISEGKRPQVPRGLWKRRDLINFRNNTKGICSRSSQ